MVLYMLSISGTALGVFGETIFFLADLFSSCIIDDYRLGSVNLERQIVDESVGQSQRNMLN